MGRSSTTTDLYQPLRRFAPPPHKWGGAALLQICISPSGASRHLPINGEEQHYYRSVSAPPALRATSPSIGRSSTTTDLYQPLRPASLHPSPYMGRHRSY